MQNALYQQFKYFLYFKCIVILVRFPILGIKNTLIKKKDEVENRPRLLLI